MCPSCLQLWYVVPLLAYISVHPHLSSSPCVLLVFVQLCLPIPCMGMVGSPFSSFSPHFIVPYALPLTRATAPNAAFALFLFCCCLHHFSSFVLYKVIKAKTRLLEKAHFLPTVDYLISRGLEWCRGVVPYDIRGPSGSGGAQDSHPACPCLTPVLTLGDYDVAMTSTVVAS